MHFVIHSPLVLPLAIASTHGLTDFDRPAHLYPYALMLWWPNEIPVTPVFALASMAHFSRDVGAWPSVALHALVGAVAAVNQDEAFFAISLYYCFVHAPLHCVRHQWALRFVAAGVALVTLACAIHAWTPSGELVIEEWMQKLVVAHVLCDELGLAESEASKISAAASPIVVHKQCNNE